MRPTNGQTDTPARWPELTNTPDMAHTKRLAFASWVMATYLPICDDIMEANNAPAWAFA